MPLLRKKPFVPVDLPPDLKADEEVFLNVLTKEIFRDYEEYFRRSILCNSLVWSCEYTGRSNLTLSEALQSEADAAEHLRKMPVVLQQAICFIIHKNEIASLTAFVDEVLGFYRTRFLIGETVEIASTDKGSSRKTGIVTDIMVNPETEFQHPNQIVYKCSVQGTSDHVSVTGNKLCRAKTLLTRERVKLLAKCSAKKVSTDPPLYAVKPDFVTKLRLDDENFNIPYLADFGKSVPKVNNKRKNRDGDDEDKKKSRKLKKKLENGDACKADEDSKEARISPEERRKQIEEEKARRKKERQEERENQKKMQTAEQLFQKEWTKPREDLLLTDSKDLPNIAPVRTALPVSLFGEVIQVSEFFHLFGVHVDLEEEFPHGVQIGALEKSLINNKQEGMFGDLVNFLLKLVFALQEEEDEEEEKLAQRYNFTYTSPTLDLSQVTMLPSVTWHTAVETKEDDSLPWMGAAQARYWPDYYLGVPLHKLQLDSYTVTEVLRLHFLGAGGRVNGANYYGRWRFNHRGMYTDHDDPSVELRRRDPSLLRMLTISNIFDLPPASKLTILTTLINEVLTFAQFREIIEEAIDGSRDAKKEWKSFGSEIHKKEKEEAASRYREWIASRIKIKEDKKKKKKKGRLSELQGKDGDVSMDSDRSMAETETDVSMAADNEEETRSSDKTAEERAEERKLDELQEHNLYIAFREISCKLKVNPLGMDRYYRKYWSFHSVPGIFVEESSLDIRTLYPDGHSQNGVKTCNGQYQLTSASQLHHDMKTNGVKEEDISNEGEYFVNQTNSLPVPGQRSAGGSSAQSDIVTIIDPASMTVEEILQLKLREATQKHGEAPETFKKLCSTPGFQLLTQDQASWCHLTTETAIRDAVQCMNPRGEREKDLIDNINKDLNRIVNDIETLPTLESFDPSAEHDDPGPDVEETEEQKTAREILKKTSSEKLIEASLREQICDLENRIFEANFGSAKVKNRMTWRQEIEDFWLDDSVKCKSTDEGDIPEIPKPIIHQRLMALRASQQSNDTSEDDASSLTSGSSTVVSRRSIILKLSQALLSVEKGVPAKYLTLPLGENPVGRTKSGTHSYKIEGEVDQISRWRESLAACTSLSQILLHISIFDSSILWSKSILKTNCRICRRKSDPDKILLCDGCDRGQHLYCMKPKLKSIPSGKWYCTACKPTSRTTRRKMKPVEVSSDEDEEEEDEEEEEDDDEEEEDSDSDSGKTNKQLSRTRSSRRDPASSNPPSKVLSLAEKLKLCQQIVKTMQEDENGWPFLYPVDGEQIPDYYKIIPNPMDLSTVQKKLRSNKYRKVDSFIEDVNQIFLNCQHYNQTRAPAYRAGVRLQKLFTKKLSEFGLN